MTKRYRVQHAKPGELRAYYGLDEDGEGPALCIANGEHVGRPDGHLLHTYLCTERSRPILDTAKIAFDPSLIDELKARGYDITTLKFSIRKLTTPE